MTDRLPELPSIPPELRERILLGEDADPLNAAVEYASAIQLAAYRAGMEAAAQIAANLYDLSAPPVARIAAAKCADTIRRAAEEMTNAG